MFVWPSLLGDSTSDQRVEWKSVAAIRHPPDARSEVIEQTCQGRASRKDGPRVYFCAPVAVSSSNIAATINNVKGHGSARRSPCWDQSLLTSVDALNVTEGINASIRIPSATSTLAERHSTRERLLPPSPRDARSDELASDRW